MDWKGIKGTVLTNVALKRYTSMKVGGPVDYLICPRDEKDLMKALQFGKTAGLPCRFMGNGTNIIVNDEGLREVVLRTTKMADVVYEEEGGEVIAEVSGGMSLKRLIEDNARRGLSGLEKLYWIPGTVGGGIKMNAGSFGSWISDHLERVRVMDTDGRVVPYSKGEMKFAYRTSRLQASECVVKAWFRLKNRDIRDIQKDMDYVYKERKKRHPMDFPSAGSIFKSVDGQPAWKFIEQAGLRGASVGGAMVSDKHANFIINKGRATAMDVKLLIDKIKREVLERTGVVLEEEVELWGFHG